MIIRAKLKYFTAAFLFVELNNHKNIQIIDESKSLGWKNEIKPDITETRIIFRIKFFFDSSIKD
jgi:hypothetical protein